MTSISPRLERAVRELVDVSVRAGNLPPLSAEKSDALREKILDQFAKGDYEAGLGALLGQSRRARDKRALNELAASALAALGVDVHQSKESLSIALSALAKGGETIPAAETPSLRASPIRGAFQGIELPLDERTQRALKAFAHQSARVEASFGLAMSAPDRGEALRALQKDLDLANTPDGILMGMLVAHREDERWADMLALYDACPKAFQELPSARREHALALAQSGQSKAAREVLNLLIHEGDRSTVTLGLNGRVLKDRYFRAIAEGDPKAAQYLDQSIRAYRMGFRVEPSGLYPGVALPLLLELQGTPAAKAEAKAVAEVLLASAERRSRFGENHYVDSAAALEMSLFLGDTKGAKRWLDETLKASAEPWMRAGTLQALERLAAARGASASAELHAAIASLSSAPRPVKTRGVSTASLDAQDPKERIMAALHAQTYRVGGRSSKWLSGNYAYSGIAHDVRVTPSDVSYFARILRGAKIDQESSPLQAISAMDTLIRARFGTDALEDLKSPAHQRFDRVMPALARFMAATRENSQTNVSADWINGLADCRQHAPVKLMLWEAWKRARTDLLSERLLEAKLKGRPQDIPAITKALDELSCWEMRILDARVLDAGTKALREEHTMTILVKRGAKGEGGPLALAEEVHLADAFYHHAYPFGGGALDVSLSGGKLALRTPAAPELLLEPAPYSADRAAKSLDFGQLLFRGQSVASPGWEKTVPVGGLDLSKLHDFVDAQALAAIAAAEEAKKPPPLY